MAVSPFSDGTPAVSQWPIPPNHFFDYEIEIVFGMAGTYFYHSHVGFQAVTAVGPLIVGDVRPVPYEYDEERLIALSDIFEKTDAQIENGLRADPFVWNGETANVLVNGKGHMVGSTISPGCELASIDVEPDKTYRLRFIGGTALSFVTLAFEDHDELTVIEVDGSYTKPINTSYLQIGSGQRFSVLLRTKSHRELSKKQFFIQIETRDRPSLTRSYAVLNYAVLCWSVAWLEFQHHAICERRRYLCHVSLGSSTESRRSEVNMYHNAGIAQVRVMRGFSEKFSLSSLIRNSYKKLPGQ